MTHSAGKYDSHQFKFAERVNYSEMRDFVGHLTVLSRPTHPAPEQPVRWMPGGFPRKGAMFLSPRPAGAGFNDRVK